ncbi:hypothetical protein UK12_26345 [Saccharothrix sp. ST-888]|nr:hypothetical protein UK12_26345 [Saccharothrix sp. ST-888]
MVGALEALREARLAAQGIGALSFGDVPWACLSTLSLSAGDWCVRAGSDDGEVAAGAYRRRPDSRLRCASSRQQRCPGCECVGR